MHLIAHENISQWLVSAILRLVMVLCAICFLINSCCFANPLVHVMGHSPAHLTNLYAFFADLLRLSGDLFILSRAVTVSAARFHGKHRSCLLVRVLFLLIYSLSLLRFPYGLTTMLTVCDRWTGVFGCYAVSSHFLLWWSQSEGKIT